MLANGIADRHVKVGISPAMNELRLADAFTMVLLACRDPHRYTLRGRSCAGFWYALLTLAAASCEVYGGRSPCGTRLA